MHSSKTLEILFIWLFYYDLINLLYDDNSKAENLRTFFQSKKTTQQSKKWIFLQKGSLRIVHAQLHRLSLLYRICKTSVVFVLKNLVPS